ncbi:type II toxin-antitoxin system RelE family toxin [Methanolobus halotolerans]|uniref:Type II toxin-antitoxin system RelE/ParE family toxin n=1 Tax=Methanolobus halotolerans TaxID=2052935 RepID=A0A4E0QAQ2_9EURY|nr:type II toxin-antitoxin system RelE/ParE family toxin [Methanolobus halotolerans]TGC09537.1 type II toxin-antitoxin system RelE/ParE family toxin [Methanolobus halotolerans]
MKYRVSIHPHVRKSLNALDPQTKTRLVEGLRKLENNPFDNDFKKLKGTKSRQDLYRLSIGDYRAIFAIEEDIVYILEVIDRDQSYKWL